MVNLTIEELLYVAATEECASDAGQDKKLSLKFHHKV
jgi:hypothetical protein